jgi:lipid II:glycine glycyltransferase (peptidoglycan interpeptide bridge formation enzyme)
MYRHLLQKQIWNETKKANGTPFLEFQKVFFTIHNIPVIGIKFGYAPRINYTQLEELNKNEQKFKEFLVDKKISFLIFDSPNISYKNKDARKTFKQINAKRIPHSINSKGNVLIKLKDKSEDEIYKQIRSSAKRKIKQAIKQNTKVTISSNQNDFHTFLKLYNQTAKEQGFIPRSKNYLTNIYNIFKKQDQIEFINVFVNNEPVASWMIFKDNKVLYYPYGGSIKTSKITSDIVLWELIKYGISNKFELIDLWGAAENPEDKTDSYYGFTKFKLKYGEHIRLEDSYVVILNKMNFKIFETLNIGRKLYIKAKIIFKI